jgi:hypothetical protein
MPRGLIRYEHTGSFHFLTFSCYHRFQYLGAAEVCDLFEDARWSRCGGATGLLLPVMLSCRSTFIF